MALTPIPNTFGSGGANLAPTGTGTPTLAGVLQEHVIAINGNSRALLLAKANGFFAETIPRNVPTSSNVIIDGTVYLTAIYLFAGEVVTSQTLNFSVGASGITLAKIGLYDKLGNRLGLSVDQGSAWAVDGIYQIPMITPVTISVPDVYYTALISKATTTLPSVINATGSAASKLLPGTLPICASMLAQTDLPTTVTFAVNPTTFGNKIIWTGLA